MIFNIAFAQQTEIDGKLKVKGEVDVSGNRITNIGDAITAGDAINTQNLQDALWDEGPYETKLYVVYCDENGMRFGGQEFICKYKKHGASDWSTNWEDELNTLTQANWGIVMIVRTQYAENLWVMRKKIE